MGCICFHVCEEEPALEPPGVAQLLQGGRGPGDGRDHPGASATALHSLRGQAWAGWQALTLERV